MPDDDPKLDAKLNALEKKGETNVDKFDQETSELIQKNHPEIDQKYAALKAHLGKPTSLYLAALLGSTWIFYRNYEHGTIISHKTLGCHATYGLIYKKYVLTGLFAGPLGVPTSDELDTPGGRKSTFERGAIFWKTGTAEAFEVHGAIGSKYKSLGGATGNFGFPMTDETMTPDRVGRFNRFEHGSIHWKPTIGAHETRGLIRDLWAAGGWENNGRLGYPISDELTVPGKADRFSDFEDGVVRWVNGAKTAASLTPTFTRTPQQLLIAIANQIGTAIGNITNLPTGAKLRITSGTRFTEGPMFIVPDIDNPFPNPPVDYASRRVTDYRLGTSRVVNRRLRVEMGLELELDSPFLADPDITIYFQIELFPNTTAGSIMARIDHFESFVEGANTDDEAKQINANLKAFLQALAPVTVSPLPPTTLSVKTLADGSLAVFTG